MKYVMFKKKMSVLTQFVPVIFPSILIHDEVAKSLLKGPLKGFKIHSAGDVTFGLEAGVSGKSETLDITHDPQDARRIAFADYSSFE